MVHDRTRNKLGPLVTDFSCLLRVRKDTLGGNFVVGYIGELQKYGPGRIISIYLSLTTGQIYLLFRTDSRKFLDLDLKRRPPDLQLEY